MFLSPITRSLAPSTRPSSLVSPIGLVVGASALNNFLSDHEEGISSTTWVRCTGDLRGRRKYMEPSDNGFCL